MPIKTTHTRGRAAKLFGAGLRTLGRTLFNRMPGGDRVQRTATYWADVGEDWVKTLGDLRGAAMKLGQLASQYSDILPPTLAEQLRKLQRSIAPLDYSEIEPILAAQWTPAQRAQFVHIEPVALAAASIGQVHRATLADGRAVVVKVRYPGVEDAVDADLEQLRRLIAVSKLLPIDDASMDKLMQEVRTRFREETDYAIELGHLHYLRAEGRFEGVVYPAPLEELCTPGILVLTEESGATLEDAATWSQELRDRIGTRLLAWVAQQIFVARAVHADPHPGNFAFRPDGTIVVYDYGCVKRIPEGILAHVRVLLRQGATSDWRGQHETLLALGGVVQDAVPEPLFPVYEEFTRLTLGVLASTDPFDFGHAAFIDDLRAAGLRHIRWSFTFTPVTDMVFVMRALGGLYWNLRALNACVPVTSILADHGVDIRPAARSG